MSTAKRSTSATTHTPKSTAGTAKASWVQLSDCSRGMFSNKFSVKGSSKSSERDKKRRTLMWRTLRRYVSLYLD
jgi:hypothetical protein